jgi:hypothetical protein
MKCHKNVTQKCVVRTEVLSPGILNETRLVITVKCTTLTIWRIGSYSMTHGIIFLISRAVSVHAKWDYLTE